MATFATTARKECQADFDSICKFYEPHNYFDDVAVAKPLLRMAHRFALHFSQIAHGAAGREEHRRIFLEEGRSDSVHLLHMLFSGDARAASFYMRSVVENFWRHIYFKDHPVEYAWLHERPGYFLTIESIRDYCKNTKMAEGALKDYVGNLANFFSTTSSVVHSTTAGSLVLRETISSIRLTSGEVKRISTLLGTLSKDILLLHGVCEHGLFDSMSSSRRSFYLDFLDTKRKAARQASLGAV